MLLKSSEKKLFLYFLGTLGAAQQLCLNSGYEVVETLVIIELPYLNGREKLTKAGHFTALTQFSEADFEVVAANPDQVHQPRDS